jgi:hypothetical protein
MKTTSYFEMHVLEKDLTFFVTGATRQFSILTQRNGRAMDGFDTGCSSRSWTSIFEL